MKKSVVSIILCLILSMATSTFVFADSSIHKESDVDINRVTIVGPDGFKITADRDSIELNGEKMNLNAQNRAGGLVRNSVWINNNMTTPLFSIPGEEGLWANSNLNLSERVYGLSSNELITVPLATKNGRLDAIANAGNEYAGTWKTVITFTVDSVDPMTITYRDHGVERVESVSNGGYDMSIYGNGVEGNYFSGYLSFFYNGSLDTTMFLGGAYFSSN